MEGSLGGILNRVPCAEPTLERYGMASTGRSSVFSPRWAPRKYTGSSVSTFLNDRIRTGRESFTNASTTEEATFPDLFSGITQLCKHQQSQTYGAEHLTAV